MKIIAALSLLLLSRSLVDCSEPPAPSPSPSRTGSPWPLASLPTSAPQAEIRPWVPLPATRSIQPTERPSFGPSDAPTGTPTNVPSQLEPTTRPASAAPMEFPSFATDSLTRIPTNVPLQTLLPTLPGIRRRAEFAGLTLEFVRVLKLSEQEIKTFEALTEDWYEGFFGEHAGLRHLQGDSAFFSIRDMTTNITVKGQKFIGGNDVNIITYDQTIDYVALENALRPEEIIRLPFSDSDKNEAYGASLSAGIEAFRLVETPILAPNFPDSDGISTGVIVGIAVGAAVACFGLVLGARKWGKPRRKDREDRSHSDLPVVNPVGPPLPPQRTGESEVAATEDSYSPTYKQQGQTVLGESQEPAFAEAVLVDD